MSNLIAYLQTPAAIRAQAEQMFQLAQQDQLKHFRYHPEAIATVITYVLANLRSNYPDLDVPFHSRWRHFEVGGCDRLAQLQTLIPHLSPRDRVKTLYELAIASVLLDAGAGPSWQYREAETGQTWQRSEGLAIASFRMFIAGGFSSDPEHPYQADAVGLQAITPEHLAPHFQVTENNNLVGIQGRSQLLRTLGHIVATTPDVFGSEAPRLGNLVDYLVPVGTQTLPAPKIFAAIITHFGSIWPGRLVLDGVNLGDVWSHSQVGYVPFHKLSQWLTYSLIEPLAHLGVRVTDLDQLTGLAEYRNGGLCLDLGLLSLKDPDQAARTHRPDSELIVEWRSLTLACLDRIAAGIRTQLNQSAQELPLVKILQGGTWAAGRKIAAELRIDGRPPLLIESDGTVF
jgi:hypothetical protein